MQKIFSLRSMQWFSYVLCAVSLYRVQPLHASSLSIPSKSVPSFSISALSGDDLTYINCSTLCKDDLAKATQICTFLEDTIKEKRLITLIGEYIPNPYTPNPTKVTVSADCCGFANPCSRPFCFIGAVQEYSVTQDGPNPSSLDPEKYPQVAADYMRLIVSLCVGNHRECPERPACSLSAVIHKKTGSIGGETVYHHGLNSGPNGSHIPLTVEASYVRVLAGKVCTTIRQLRGHWINERLTADITVHDENNRVDMMLYFPYGNSRTCAALKKVFAEYASLPKKSGKCTVL